MTTTTVTGTGRRLSIRQSNWQPPSKTMVSPPLSSPNTTPLDKFPPFEEGTPTTLLTPTNRRFSHSQRDGLNDMWQPRQPAHITWQRPNGLDASKHRPRKSISDAITTIRTRNASMSANAQELAEALKAPISYKLIVSRNDLIGIFWLIEKLIDNAIGILPRLVHDLSSHQHLLQINSQCSQKADYPYYRAVCFRSDMVLAACLLVNSISGSAESRTCAENGYTLPLSRCDCDRSSLGHFPACRTHT